MSHDETLINEEDRALAKSSSNKKFQLGKNGNIQNIQK